MLWLVTQLGVPIYCLSWHSSLLLQKFSTIFEIICKIQRSAYRLGPSSHMMNCCHTKTMQVVPGLKQLFPELKKSG